MTHLNGFRFYGLMAMALHTVIIGSRLSFLHGNWVFRVFHVLKVFGIANFIVKTLFILHKAVQ